MVVIVLLIMQREESFMLFTVLIKPEDDQLSPWPMCQLFQVWMQLSDMQYLTTL